MQPSSIRRATHTVRNPLSLGEPTSLAAGATSRTIPLMVSHAEYQRLRGSQRKPVAAQEPIDRKLAELLDSCY